MEKEYKLNEDIILGEGTFDNPITRYKIIYVTKAETFILQQFRFNSNIIEINKKGEKI